LEDFFFIANDALKNSSNCLCFFVFYYHVSAVGNCSYLRLRAVIRDMKISNERDLFLVIGTSNIFLVISLFVGIDSVIEDDRFDSVERRILAIVLFRMPLLCTRDLCLAKITAKTSEI